MKLESDALFLFAIGIALILCASLINFYGV